MSAEMSLPDSWIITQLGKYIYLKNGYAFKSNSYVDEKGSNTVPIIRISDIDGKYATDLKAMHVNSSAAAFGFEVEKGDLLIAMSGATTGKVGVYNGNIPAYQNQRVGNLKFINETYKSESFRNHLIAYLSPDILKIAYGGAQPNISGKAIEEMNVVIPPLAEQHQIAQILDELLAQVDTIKARLDAIPAILKRFRQSVLSAAVSGKLTEELRDNTDYKSHEFSEKWKWHELPSSWNVNFFENIVECRLGKMLDKAKNFGKQTKYLGNINVRWFHFELTNLQEILVTEKEQFELSLAKGDLLICEGGEPGRCAIWSEKSDEPIIFQKALHRARVKDAVIPEWIAINLKNDCDNQTLEQLFTGTTIKHLTGKALKKYPLRLPPINEQTEIVRQVDRFFTFAEQIEQRVNDAKARVDKLTQSILAKAFRGELTADWRAEHPELISGENSAEALLAKIQAAKAALDGKKKKGKVA